MQNLKSQLDESEVRYEKLLEVGEEMKKELTKKIEVIS